MAEWLDLSIRLEGGKAFLLLIPVALGLSYYAYRQALGPERRGVRSALVALRSLALGLLLLILTEPILGLWSKEVVYPLVLILVDTSSSMATEEEGVQRLERVRAVLRDGDFGRELGRSESLAYGFAEESYEILLDTLELVQTGGQATDLASSLRQSLEQIAERKKLENILLISDGAHNLGEDPVRVAREIGVPVYTLGVGSDDGLVDIQIVQAKAAEIGYLGHNLNIEAELRSWGYKNRPIDVLLYEGKKEIGRQRLVLTGDNVVQKLSFDVLPNATGPHIYRLVVAAQKGEVSRENNEALVFTRILEERVQVLLVAGSPSPDLAFLYRSLALDSTIVVQTAVQKNSDSFYQRDFDLRKALVDKDVLVLINPGPGLLSGSMGNTIKEGVDSGVGLLFVGGPRTYKNWDPNMAVAEILPVATERRGVRFLSGAQALRLSPEGRHHPVVRLQQGATEVGGDPWMQMPPLPGYFPLASKSRGAIVLVEGQGEGHPSFILSGSYGKGKVIAALSAAFWRLDLLSSGVGGRPQTIRNFWRDAVKWLAIQMSAGRLRVSTERHIYRAGEKVIFAAQVFDELLRPQNAATVQVELDKEGLEFQLQDQGGGRYQGSWAGLAPGTHHYAASAYGNGFIGEDEGRFIVERHSVESVDVRADTVLLGEIARASGGRYRALGEWREMLELLDLQKHLVEKSTVVSLWDQRWLVVIVVLLLGSEWFVRKRCGMI